jgi:hypothetical protein
VWVERGGTNADTGWVCTADQGGTLGSTAITWTQFSGAGSITAGTGLTKTGNQIALDTAYTDGAYANIGGDTFTGAVAFNAGLTGTTSALTGKVTSGTTALNNTPPSANNDLTRKDYVDGLFVNTVSPSRTLTATTPIRIDGGNSADLSANRTLSVLPFGSAQAGVVPASGGGTTAFLRADGTWTAPGGGGTVNKYAGDVNAGSAISAGTEYTVTHNLNTLDVDAQFIRKTTPAAGAAAGSGIYLTWRAITVNTIGVTCDVGFAANEIRAIVTA